MKRRILATATAILILATVFTGCGRDKELNPVDKAVLQQKAAQVSAFWEEKDKTTVETTEETTTEATTSSSSEATVEATTTDASTETTTEVEPVDLQANRSRLSPVEQKAYDEFLKKIYKYEKFVVDFSEEEFSFKGFHRVKDAIQGDHPEIILFLFTDESISSERWDGKPRYIQVSYKYHWLNEEEFEEEFMDDYLAQIDEVCDEIISSMPEEASNAEKYEYLGREICQRTGYFNSEKVSSSDGYLNGSLLEGEASCQGYSYAYQYLCHRAGLWCVTVFSKTHCWNIVMLEDGSTYHVDLTWADSTGDFEANFLLTQEEAEVARTPIEGSWVATGK